MLLLIAALCIVTFIMGMLYIINGKLSFTASHTSMMREFEELKAELEKQNDFNQAMLREILKLEYNKRGIIIAQVMKAGLADIEDTKPRLKVIANSTTMEFMEENL